MSLSNPQSSPSATTKSLEEILEKYFTGEQYDEIHGTFIRIPFKKQMDEALAAINNLINQRVIEELQGFSSGHLTNSGHKYLTKRYESLKGGIDE